MYFLIFILWTFWEETCHADFKIIPVNFKLKFRQTEPLMHIKLSNMAFHRTKAYSQIFFCSASEYQAILINTIKSKNKIEK